MTIMDNETKPQWYIDREEADRVLPLVKRSQIVFTNDQLYSLLWVADEMLLAIDDDFFDIKGEDIFHAEAAREAALAFFGSFKGLCFEAQLKASPEGHVLYFNSFEALSFILAGRFVYGNKGNIKSMAERTADILIHDKAPRYVAIEKKYRGMESLDMRDTKGVIITFLLEMSRYWKEVEALLEKILSDSKKKAIRDYEIAAIKESADIRVI